MPKTPSWFAAGAVGLLMSGSHAFAQDGASQTTSDASDLAPFTFTAGQAVGGKTNYQRLCAECHGNALEGTQGPALSGDTFSHRLGAPVSELFEFIQQQMPAGAGGTLSDTQVATIIVHIAKSNGMKPSTEAMPSDPAELEGIRFSQ